MTALDTPQVTQGDIERAKQAIVGDMPLMDAPPDTHVKLCRGLFQGTGYATNAEIKELSGDDEEYIARSLAGSDSLSLVNAMLTYGVLSIGSVDLRSKTPVDRIGYINQLLVGDKELLFLRILQITFGDERVVDTICPVCEKRIEVVYHISKDIPIRELTDERPTYDFVLRNGDRLEYRLVTGDDQTEATKRRASMLPEQNSILLSRCIVSVNGRPLVDPLHFAKALSAGDRRNLLKEINLHQPGPHFEEVKLPCAECGVESGFAPAWADLL
jgi:hypothetical protein